MLFVVVVNLQTVCIGLILQLLSHTNVLKYRNDKELAVEAKHFSICQYSTVGID